MKCMACSEETGRDVESLCPECEVGMFEHDAETALSNLIEGYRKLLKLNKEKQNDYS